MASPSPWPRQQQQQHHRKRAIDELVRGRELAYELQVALKRSLADPSSLSVHQHHHQDLVSKILGSFCDTISILHYSSPESDEISQLFPLPPNTVDSQYSSDARKSEDSSDSCKPLTATSKDRRGCYKRRRTSETWSKESSSLMDDGHAWRKYGQKVILNAKHPRNYFRCTHKFDQGCQATKQVQMIQENPPIHRTTYHGRHTCKNLLRPPQIILDTTAPRDSSFFLSFDQSIKPNSNNNDSRRNNNSFTAAVFPLTKQDTKEDVVQGLLNVSSSSCDYFLSPPDLTGPLSSAGSDHGDVISSGVYSCTASTHDSLGMDLVVGSVDDFDDVLQFEF